MSQQKFFSGLTEGMMNRSAGVDRMKSSVFWQIDEDEGRETNQSETSGHQNRNARKSVVQNGEHNSNHKNNISNNQKDNIEMGKTSKERHETNLNSTFEFNEDVVDDSSYDAATTISNNIRQQHNNKKHRNSMTKDEDFRHFSRQTSAESEEAKSRKQNVLQSSIKFYDYDDSANNQFMQHNHHQVTSRNGDNRSDYHTTSSRYTGIYTHNDYEEPPRNRANSLPEFMQPQRTEPKTSFNPHRHLQSSIAFSNGSSIGEEK